MTKLYQPSSGGSGTMAIGGTVTSGTTGSVLFVGAGPVLAQDNSNLFWDDTNNRLGIGTASPGAQVHIDGSATDVKLKVQGASGQTNDIVAIYNGGGGARSIAVTNTAANASSVSFFPDTSTSIGNAFINFSGPITQASNTSFAGFNASPVVTLTIVQTNTNIHTPFNSGFTLKNDGIVVGNLGKVTAFSASPQVISNTTLCGSDRVVCFSANPTFSTTNSGTLVITEFVGCSIGGNALTGATVTTRKALSIDSFVAVGGSIATDVGIFINDLAATTKYAIISVGATAASKHGGKFGILVDPEGTDPAARFQVEVSGGSNCVLLSTTGSNPTKWLDIQDSSANTITKISSLGYLELIQTAATISATTKIITLGAVTNTVSANVAISMIESSATFSQTATVSTATSFFLNNSTYINNTSLSGGSLSNVRSFASTPTLTADTNTFTVALYMAGTDNPTFNRTNSGTLNVTNWISWRSLGTVGAGVTVTTRAGFRVDDITNSGTVTNNIAYDIPGDLTAGGTLIAGFRSVITSGTGKWNIYCTGTASSSHAGSFRFGDNTAPTALIDVAGLTTISTAGLVTKYNNQTTTGTGVPYLLQSPATSATKTANFTVFSYTPAATAATYQVFGVISTTSATNTGTVKFTLDYVDSNGTTHTGDVIPLVDDTGAINQTRSGPSKEFHSIPWLFTVNNSATAIALKVVITGTVSYTVTGTLERVI